MSASEKKETIGKPADQPRPYQRTALRNIERAFAKHRRVLFVEFMGTGKTVVAALVVRSWVAQGARVLVLVHRGEILKQTHKKLIRAGIPASMIGIVWADHKGVNLSAPIQLASVQTLARREGSGEMISHILVDEAHHAQAASWRKILDSYPEAKVLGLTATPERLDGKPLGDLFDEMVLGESPENLIEGGYLAQPEIWTRADGWRPEMKGAKRRGGDYAAEVAARAMSGSTIVGGIPKAYLKHAKGLPAVLFAATVEQAQGLAAAFVSAGVAAETLLGEDVEKEREAKLTRLRTGRTAVLATCDLLGEGWDYQGCRCVIMARPTASLSRFMQWAGRCMRPGGRAVVLDHAGNFYAFGPPWEERDWSLHTKAPSSLRAASADAEGRVVFLEPKEVAGKLVRADEIERQTECPGWGGPCPSGKRPPPGAFEPSEVARRHGDLWRCQSCATRKGYSAVRPLNAERDAAIVAEFRPGKQPGRGHASNASELAKKHGLSRGQIHSIIASARRRRRPQSSRPTTSDRSPR